MSNSIEVTITPDDLRAQPGAEVEAVIEVTNAGRILDFYSIEVAGVPEGWWRLSESELSIFPGDTQSAGLTLTAPDGNEAIAGKYKLEVRVTSANIPGDDAKITCAFVVEPEYSFFHDLHPTKVTGVEGHFVTTITNTGNAELTYHFEGEDPEGFCSFSFEPNPVVLPPSEETDVAIVVKPSRRPFIGRAKPYNLTFTITPEETPEVVTLPAQLDAIPKFRRWHIPLAALLVLALMAAGYSAFWALFEKDNVTYLRGETWTVTSLPFQAKHGLIYPFVFDLAPLTKDEDVLGPPPVILRGKVSWPDTDEDPPSMAVILKGPLGNCWGPRQLGADSEPFQFSVFDGGVPCSQILFEDVLLNRVGHETNASRYSPTDIIVDDIDRVNEHFHINPVARYCVREGGSVIYDGRTPRQFGAGSPLAIQARRDWTVYVANPHAKADYPTSPQVTLRMKVTAPEANARKKDKAFGMRLVRIPTRSPEWPPLAASSKDTCGVKWDDTAGIPADGGLIHGTIYVKKLEFCRRPEGACLENVTVLDKTPASGLASQLHAVPGGSPDCSALAIEGSAAETAPGPISICGDIVWENGQPGVAPSAFVVLRDPNGHCWTSLEGKTVAGEDQASPFFFDLNSLQTCEDIIQEATLWFLVSWFPTDSERPRPAAYNSVSEPLVRFCQTPATIGLPALLFDASNAIPRQDAASYPRNPGVWNIFVMTGVLSSGDVLAPNLTLNVKGDSGWAVNLIDLPASEKNISELMVECPPDLG